MLIKIRFMQFVLLFLAFQVNAQSITPVLSKTTIDNNKMAQVHAEEGDAAKANRDWKAAETAYTKALELDASLAGVWAGRGWAKYLLDKDVEAIADFNQAINLEPNFPYAFNCRGLVNNTLGKHNEALADFDKAILLNPAFAQPYANKGQTLLKLGDKARFNEAIALLDKGLSLNKNMDWAEAVKKEALSKR